MRSHMDLEDFLAITYTPIKAVEILTNIIYEKSNNDWGLYSCGNRREEMEELLAINFAIKLCARYLLKIRHENLLELNK